VFTFSDAHFAGSGAGSSAADVAAIASTLTDQGYWLFVADGTVTPFGDAAHLGSLAGSHLNAPIVAAGFMTYPT
jgi:hypothetical protein